MTRLSDAFETVITDGRDETRPYLYMAAIPPGGARAEREQSRKAAGA